MELKLILSCLQVSAGQNERNQNERKISALCRRVMDWDAFMKLVNRHRIPSQVYINLKRFAGNSVPEPVIGTLRERSHRNTQQVLAKTAELVRIVKRFEQNHIRILPFKGPVLALQVYDDLGSRHVGDLDIMVPLDRVKEAENLLVQQGYKRTNPDFHLTRKQYAAYVRNNHHFGYFCKDRRIKVELHWRFGSNRYLFPLRFNDLWRNRQTVRLGGADMASLSLEHTILLLCAHGAVHAWFRLFWLNDIARIVIKNHSIDWNMLMRHAEQLGISRMVAEGAILANQLLGSPLPEPISAFAKKDKRLQRLVTTSLYLIKYQGKTPYSPNMPAYWHSKYNLFMLRSDLKYKLGFCFAHINATFSDWDRVPLPDALFPLYYLVRPITWFFRWYVPRTRVYREEPRGRGKNGAAR